MAAAAHLPPLQIPPAVSGAHGMAPFKCMRAPLAAGIKKIKGGRSLFFLPSLFYFFLSERFSLSNVSSVAQGEKGNGKLLLSLKLQGVSFIMKVQRQREMCVACFLPPARSLFNSYSSYSGRYMK